MGIMPTKTELALEQTQQGVSNKVLMLSGIEDSHHGPSDAMHNPPSPLKNIRVILHSIHSDDGNPSSANIKQALR
ncbi:hypothetical protein Tco_1451175, partial [Tanacetum coccineum]